MMGEAKFLFKTILGKYIVYFFEFVGIMREALSFNEAFFDELFKEVIGLAQRYAQFLGNVALGNARGCLYLFNNQ